MAVQLPDIPRRLFPAKQVKELDRLAIDEKNISGIDLMERAGMAAWNHILQTWPRSQRILIVCGAGNNAGDGYVVARYGLENEMEIEVVALTDPETLQGDARTAAQKWLATGHSVHRSISEVDLNVWDIIVDAILGTGLDRNVEGDYFNAISTINMADPPVLSIDIPSGLNADTGLPMGVAIKAEQTITFIGKKQGLYLGHGSEYRGKVEFNDLAIPIELYQSVDSSSELVDVSSYNHLLSRRSRTGHKGDYGHVLIAGGEHGMAGAVVMCGEAAARAGTGLVSIATRKEHAISIPAARPEMMTLGIDQVADLNTLLSRATVVAIGPGLGQSEWSLSLLSRVLDTSVPMVVDADALNLLAQDPVKRDNWILTPHPGEAARLLKCRVDEVQADRLAAVSTLQDKYGGVIVLKGPGTIIRGSSGRMFVCTDGNPGMATGGMGDMLTGIIAGLLAQKFTAEDAAGMGCCLHARAADLSAARNGERGMMATDLLPYIRQLVNPR